MLRLVLCVQLSHFCRAMISEKNALSGCYTANVLHDSGLFKYLNSLFPKKIFNISNPLSLLKYLCFVAVAFWLVQKICNDRGDAVGSQWCMVNMVSVIVQS